jgi:hypothetical protein
MRYVLVLAIIAMSFVPLESQRSPVQFDTQEALDLTRQLIVAVNPDLPENAYMPSPMREKIAWVMQEYRAKRLDFRLAAFYSTDTQGKKRPGVVMASYLRNGKPTLEIFGPPLLVQARMEQGLRTGFNDFVKDNFALAFAHEGIHFETLPLPNLEHATRVKEEDRAWRRVVIGMVRPLRKAGRELEPAYLAADDILIQCQDRPVCPEFTKFLSTRSGG